MKFPDPLLPGKLIGRYKRFFADVELDSGELVTAHCANTGAMTGLKEPGLPVWLSPARNPKRKLKYTWELVEVDGGLVGINTAHPNRLAEEAVEAAAIPELTGYDTIRREVKYGRNSRIDLLLSDGQGERPDCYVEVKNVHLRRNGSLAEFPDGITARGTKHLAELSDMVAAGHRAVMLYMVQRQDCHEFSIAGDIDPAYDKALGAARRCGVEALCYACRLSPVEITLDRPLTLAL